MPAKSSRSAHPSPDLLNALQCPLQRAHSAACGQPNAASSWKQTLRSFSCIASPSPAAVSCHAQRAADEKTRCDLSQDGRGCGGHQSGGHQAPQAGAGGRGRAHPTEGSGEPLDLSTHLASCPFCRPSSIQAPLKCMLLQCHDMPSCAPCSRRSAAGEGPARRMPRLWKSSAVTCALR